MPNQLRLDLKPGQRIRFEPQKLDSKGTAAATIARAFSRAMDAADFAPNSRIIFQDSFDTATANEEILGPKWIAQSLDSNGNRIHYLKALSNVLTTSIQTPPAGTAPELRSNLATDKVDLGASFDVVREEGVIAVRFRSSNADGYFFSIRKEGTVRNARIAKRILSDSNSIVTLKSVELSSGAILTGAWRFEVKGNNLAIYRDQEPLPLLEATDSKLTSQGPLYLRISGNPGEVAIDNFKLFIP